MFGPLAAATLRLSHATAAAAAPFLSPTTLPAANTAPAATGYHENGSTSWDLPTAAAPAATTSAAVAAAAASSTAAEAGLPRGWSTALDESGATYYVNEATGESSWERPAAAQQAAQEQAQQSQEQSLPGGWAAVWSAADNAYYYERDGETTWTRPSA